MAKGPELSTIVHPPFAICHPLVIFSASAFYFHSCAISGCQVWFVKLVRFELLTDGVEVPFPLRRWLFAVQRFQTAFWPSRPVFFVIEAVRVGFAECSSAPSLHGS